MRSISPKQQAIIIAIISAIINVLAGLLWFLFVDAHYLVILLFVGLLVFLAFFSSYFIRLITLYTRN